MLILINLFPGDLHITSTLVHVGKQGNLNSELSVSLHLVPTYLLLYIDLFRKWFIF